ncbi:MAG TPA: ferredoxin-NADP reductase [Sneathiellales bacterium]|jgi:ferredoxin--NADP+ reductase|nr:ferredoxin-NADP reductase [Sneathiellales bacterium]HIL07729.1 ferredoxin-NADP reductase [Candidatus Latescibacterota bacterium]
MSLSVAVVGSGPGGLYAVEALTKNLPDCRIDIIDRLPSPYGLVRFGVAPDHQTTKNVSRVFDKQMVKDNVRYLGNVELGRDISYDELKDMYDAVVLAFGTPIGRRLGLPGEDAEGVYNSDAIVAWYSGHPDFENLNPDLTGKAAIIIGIGNVALDVARLFARTEAELADTDTTDFALDAIKNAHFDDIYIVGRRGPIEGTFTRAELGELGELERGVALVHEEQLPEEVEAEMDPRDLREKVANLKVLRSYIGNDPNANPVKVHFEFYASPKEFLTETRDGKEHVVGVRVERTKVENGRAVGTGEEFDIAADVVVPSVGYQAEPSTGAPLDEWGSTVENTDGRVEPGVYAVGWAKRGPTGTIALNRKDSHGVVNLLLEDITADPAKSGSAGVDRLLADRGVRVVSYYQWQKIDQAEVVAANPPAPRKKFTSIEAMLDALDR